MITPHTNTGYEPNSELDMAGRFVPIVDLTQDDEEREGNFHVVRHPVAASRECTCCVY